MVFRECFLTMRSAPVDPIVLHIFQFQQGIPSPALVHALYLKDKKTRKSILTTLSQLKDCQ